MSETQLPLKLGPFELESLLGRGGMGEVWRAVHGPDGASVAVKVITAEKARQERTRRAFVREVQALAGLHHRGIVSVLDYGLVPGEASASSGGRLVTDSPYLVLEVAEGGTLAQAVDGVTTWRTLRRVLVELLEALAHAHARGVVHRDIKPANVLLTSPELDHAQLRLTDFGIAFALDDGRGDEELRQAVGSIKYMAPEQILGQWRDQGPWTDLYAVGGLGWWLASGVTPFSTGTETVAEVVLGHIERPLPSLVPRFAVPPGFEAWLRALLARSPQARYRRAADALADLIGLGMVASVVGSDLALGARAESGMDDTQMEPQWSGATVVLSPVEVATDVFASPGWRPGVAEVPPTWREPSGPPSRERLQGAGLGLYGLRRVPLAAREVERDLLWDALLATRASGRARAVVLSGPPGVGKSRLAGWLCERAHEAGAAIVVKASHGPIVGQATGLRGLVAEQLRLGGLGRAEAQSRTRTLLARRGVDPDLHGLALAEIAVPASAGGTDAVQDGAPFRFASDQERHQAVVHMLELMSRERPVIAWVDDVHWGWDVARLVLSVLNAQDTHPLPILFVLVARDDLLAESPAASVLDAIRARAGTVALALPPLGEADQVALVEELLGLAPTLARRVAQRSEGNPLFAVQLVGDWVQRGLLEPSPGGFELHDDGSAWLPSDVAELWAERVGQVLRRWSGGARSALELAAALGPTVAVEEWTEACAVAGIEVPTGLVAALSRAGLVTRHDDGWAFVHGMLRESLERQAELQGRRGVHHRACADMLEARRARTGQRGLSERIGLHRMAAGEFGAAAERLLDGVLELRSGGDFADAEVLLAAQRRALSEAGLDGDQALVVRSRIVEAEIHRRRGRLDEAIAVASDACERARRLGDPVLEARASLELGGALAAFGRVREDREALGRSVAVQHEAFERTERAGLSDVTTDAAISLAMTTLMLADPDGAERWYHRALGALGGRESDLRVGFVQVGLADIALGRGRLAEAGRWARLALACFVAHGAAYHLCHAEYVLAEVALAGGEFVEAERFLRRSLAFVEATGSFNAIVLTYRLAVILLVSGAPGGEACTLLESAIRRLDDQRQPHFLRRVSVALVWAFARQGAREQARQQVERLLRLEPGPSTFDDAQIVAEAEAALRALGEDELADRLGTPGAVSRV